MKKYKTSEHLRESVRKTQRGQGRAGQLRRMWLSARTRAERAGREFNLTRECMLSLWPADEVCPALGIPFAPPNLNTTKQGPRDNSPTLDRIDNTQGYSFDNCVIISWRANRIKNTASAKELLAISRWLDSREKLKELL